jgi:hypothetical protein
MKKGESFNFNFDPNGELMLFESSNNIKISYPPQTAYNIDNLALKFIQIMKRKANLLQIMVNFNGKILWIIVENNMVAFILWIATSLKIKE